MTTEMLNLLSASQLMTKVNFDGGMRGVKRAAATAGGSDTDEDCKHPVADEQLTPPNKRRLSEEAQLSQPEENNLDDNERKSGSSSAKRRRNRRRRQKRSGHLKGYYEMTETERDRYEERTRNKVERTKERMLKKGHMLAPYNSTQFLINDANDDTVRLLDEALHDDGGSLSPASSSFGGGDGKSRSRQSSLSIEDDDEYFYSSPDDEDDFLTKEFSKDYERSSVDRLESMNKDRLICEYLGMEKQVEALEKRLEEIQNREAMKALTGEVDYEFSRGEVPMEPETAQKIKVFQTEIRRLMKENKTLHLENARLKRKHRTTPARGSWAESTSSDEEETSSGGNNIGVGGHIAGSIQSDLLPMIQAAVAAGKSGMCSEDGGKTEDTGYESTQSKEQTPERDVRRWSGRDEKF